MKEKRVRRFWKLVGSMKREVDSDEPLHMNNNQKFSVTGLGEISSCKLNGRTLCLSVLIRKDRQTDEVMALKPSIMIPANKLDFGIVISGRAPDIGTVIFHIQNVPDIDPV